MKLYVVLSLLLSALQYSLGAAPPPPSATVISLNKNNFEQEVFQASVPVLVKFFTTWCGHCKKLAPEYMDSAVELEGTSKLTEVDCDKERELCEEYKIPGFPTLIAFEAGQKMDCRARTKPEIVAFMKSLETPPVRELTTAAAFDQIRESNKVLIVFFGTDKSSPEYSVFNSVAREYRFRNVFGSVLDSDIISREKMSTPSIAVYRSWMTDTEAKAVYKGEFEPEPIKEFLEKKIYPPVVELDQNSIRRVLGDNAHTPLVVLIVADEKDTGLLDEVAIKNLDKLNFVYILHQQHPSFLSGFGISESDIPTIVIFNPKKNLKYQFYPDTRLSTPKVEAYLKDFLADKIKPFFKSQPVPASEFGPPLYKLNHERYQDFTAEHENVFVMVHSPRCKGCVEAMPHFEKVAKKITVKSIACAVYDGLANDPPQDIEISAFPLFYITKNKGKDVEIFTGEPTEAQLINFVISQAKDGHLVKQVVSAPAREHEDL